MRHYTDPRRAAAKAIAIRREHRYNADSFDVMNEARSDLARHCAALLRGESVTEQTGREMLADARVLASAELLVSERVERLLQTWRRQREQRSA